MTTTDSNSNVALTAWNERVGAFAGFVGITLEDANAAFAGIVGDPGDEALSLLGDKNAAPDEDIKKALEPLKIPTAKLNMHLPKLRNPEKVADSSSKLHFLPSAPDEESFLSSLKIGGELKVGTPEIISAVRACIASRAGSYSALDKIKAKMERWAESQGLPYSEKYFEIQDMLTERNYADVLSAIKVKSRYITEAKRKEFLDKIEKILWPELKSFHSQLKDWIIAYNQLSMNPANLVMALKGNGNNIPMQVVDTGGLRSAAEEVINKINKVFAGPGIPVARALAQDAIRINKIINDDSVLIATGSGTKDQLLRDLDLAVGADIVRAEQNIVQYTLSIMNLPKVTPEDEVNYLLALNNLGVSIPWDKLGGSSNGSTL